jgi:pyruvate/2-oxoglutarate dehydrogenase complex dihydrolipoamide acyltransferase (E2) component
MLPVRNVKLGAALEVSPWRKISFGSWRPTGDSSVNAIVELDANPALDYMEKLRAETGARVTISHLVARAVAEMIRRHPEINCILRFGKLYPRRDVDVFLHVASDEKGEDLSGLVIRGADRKAVPEIAREMDARVEKIRKRQDSTFVKVKGLIGRLPGLLSRLTLDLSSFIMYSLNLWHPVLGAPRDAFGSVMITNIGALDLEMAFVPIAPYTRIPLVFAVGAVKEKPVVQGGAVVPGRVLTLCATFDHRIIDGMHGSHMVKTLRKIFADPRGELEAAAPEMATAQ